jgi:hypothetical protein
MLQAPKRPKVSPLLTRALSQHARLAEQILVSVIPSSVHRHV